MSGEQLAAIELEHRLAKLESENASLKAIIEVMEAQQDKIMSELTNMHDNTISLNLHESKMWALEKQLAEAKEEADLWRKRSAYWKECAMVGDRVKEGDEPIMDGEHQKSVEVGEENHGVEDYPANDR